MFIENLEGAFPVLPGFTDILDGRGDRGGDDPAKVSALAGVARGKDQGQSVDFFLFHDFPAVRGFGRKRAPADCAATNQTIAEYIA